MPERRRQDADNREAFRLVRPIADIGGERAADDPGICAEPALPQPVTDQGTVRRAWRERVRVERTADGRHDTKSLHEPGSHPRPRDRLGLLPANQIEDIEIPGDLLLENVVQ